MADTSAASIKTPWHLWVVGVVALLWNSMGALDFTMTQMKSEAYLKALTPEQLAYIHGFPRWVVFVWGLGTWAKAPDATTVFPQRMTVDFIRVFQRNRPPCFARPAS